MDRWAGYLGITLKSVSMIGGSFEFIDKPSVIEENHRIRYSFLAVKTSSQRHRSQTCLANKMTETFKHNH